MKNRNIHELVDEFFGATYATQHLPLQGGARTFFGEVGAALPEAYEEFLRRIESQAVPEIRRLGGFRFLQFDEVLSAWESFCQLDDSKDEVDLTIAGDTDARVRRFTCGRDRLPIAQFNGNVWIFLDFDPAPGGVAGQVIQVDLEALNWYWLADSFEHLLEELVDGRSLDPDMGTQDEDE